MISGSPSLCKALSVLFLFSFCCLIFSCFADCFCCRLVSTAQKPRLATFLLHVIQQNLRTMLARNCFIFASHTLLKYREYPLKGSSSRWTLLLTKTQWAVVAEEFTISSSTNSAGMHCVYVAYAPSPTFSLYLFFLSLPRFLFISLCSNYTTMRSTSLKPHCSVTVLLPQNQNTQIPKKYLWNYFGMFITTVQVAIKLSTK